MVSLQPCTFSVDEESTVRRVETVTGSEIRQAKADDDDEEVADMIFFGGVCVCLCVIFVLMGPPPENAQPPVGGED